MKKYTSIEIVVLSVSENDIVRTSVLLGDSDGFGDVVEY